MDALSSRKFALIIFLDWLINQVFYLSLRKLEVVRDVLLKLFDFRKFCRILCTFAVLIKNYYYETKIFCNNSAGGGYAASCGSSR